MSLDNKINEHLNAIATSGFPEFDDLTVGILYDLVDQFRKTQSRFDLYVLQFDLARDIYGYIALEFAKHDIKMFTKNQPGYSDWLGEELY